MIGIIGGYGAIGICASTLLQKWGGHTLKIGGRNPQQAQEKYSPSFSNAVWEKVDVNSEESIQEFIKDCDLVINCTGPSHKMSSRIAKVCIAQECHLVDSGYDRRLASLKLNNTDTCLLYHAGATPGFSGIVPIWCASQFDEVHKMVTYIGALEKPSRTGIEDYLEGTLDETSFPRAAWKNGKLATAVLTRSSQVELPFFDRRLTTIPIFDSESEHVAKVTSMVDGEWYFVLDGDTIMKALDTASALYRTSPKEAIEKLYLSTSLDTVGVAPYFRMLVQVEGVLDGKPTTKTFVLDTNGTNTMSGCMVAACAIAVLDAKIRPGIKPAYKIENTDIMMQLISELGGFHTVQILDHSIVELLQEEEGTI